MGGRGVTDGNDPQWSKQRVKRNAWNVDMTRFFERELHERVLVYLLSYF